MLTRNSITRCNTLIRKEAKTSGNGGLNSTSRRHLFSGPVLLELLFFYF